MAQKVLYIISSAAALRHSRLERSMPSSALVSIVDDDVSMREALRGLLRAIGLDAEAFASAEEFLVSGRISATACLLLDVRMPGLSGLQLQEQLLASGSRVPIIFISAHSD